MAKVGQKTINGSGFINKKVPILIVYYNVMMKGRLIFYNIIQIISSILLKRPSMTQSRQKNITLKTTFLLLEIMGKALFSYCNIHSG